MTDRTITWNVRANVQGAVNQMKSLADATKRASSASLDWASNNEQAIGDITRGLGVAGLAMTGFATLAVKKAADFDKAMSSVQAATMESAGNMALLREAAIQAGADTAYSATEAAAAIEELAKAGVSTADILSGGLAGALDLAASDGLAVAKAAEIASSAMTQFKLGGEDVTHIADLLAAGAGKAQGGVEDLGMALNQAGLVASQTGLSIEETTGGLAAFASAGLIGSDAGTSFKTMLQSLTPSSKEAATLMDQLGISAYDSQGNFIGLAEYAGVLQGALKTMTVEQQNATLKTIFGADAVRAASVLYQQGEAGIRQWTSAVNEQGYAAEQARIRLDNLAGDVEGLQGSLETALIKGGTGLNGMLRGAVQGADAAVDAIGQLPDSVLSVTTAIVGSGGLVALGAAGFGKLLTSVATLKQAAEQLGWSFKKASIAAGAVGAAVTVASAALVVWATNAANAKAAAEAYAATLDHLGGATEETGNLLSDRLSGREINWWDSFVNGGKSAVDLMDEMGIAASDVRGYIEGEAAAVDRVTAAMDQYAEGATFWNKQYGGRAGAVSQLTKWLDEERTALERGAKMNEDKAALDGEVALTTEQLTAAIQRNLGVTQEIAPGTQAAQDAMAEWSGVISDANGSFIDLQGAYDDVMAKQEELGDAAKVSAEAYISELKKQAEAQANWADNLVSVSDRVNKKLPLEMRDTANAMIDELAQLGPEGAEQVALLESMSDKELQSVVKLYAEKGGAAGQALADRLAATKVPELDVNVNTGGIDVAASKLETFVSTWQGKTVTVSATAMVYSASGGMPGGGTGTRPPSKKAAGGGISGGIAGVDSVPILAMPGEHMLTTRDVQAMGGQGAVYAFRKSLHAGLPRFASGGAVGSSEKAVTSWRRQVLAERERVKQYRRDTAAAEKAVAADRNDPMAKGWLKNEKAQLARAEKNLARLEKNLDTARARLARLREQRYDTSLDISRGNIREQATSSLSGAYGVSDQMRSLLRSGDLTDSQEKSLRGTIQRAEKAMKSLYGQADRVEKKLAAARDRVEELSSIKASAASAISQFSLAGAMAPTQQTNEFGEVWYEAPTGKSMLGSAKAYAAKARTFALTLRKLQEKGFGGAVLQEVASMGIEEGQVAAEALLQLSKADAKELTAAYDSIDTWANRAGQVVTEGFYKGGLSAAEGLVKGLESQQAAIEKQITKIAIGMENALKRALGIKSPSRVFRSLGRFTGEGMKLGLEDEQAAVSKAAQQLVSIPASVPMNVAPAAMSAQAVALPAVYVQNPFTGEYLLAKVSTVADGRIVAYTAEQDRAAAYVGS